MAKIADILQILEQIAPRELAEDWDNVGLQFGDAGWPVNRVFVALDPTMASLEAAVDTGADLLVTHHPLIFKPLKSVDVTTPTGAILDLAARKRVAVFAAHTNLDSVEGGINDVLAEKIGLCPHAPLSPARRTEVCKLVVFVPRSDADSVLDALSRTPAGNVGDYSACAFYGQGRGRFVPGEAAHPRTGSPGELTETDEVRIETRVEKSDIDTVITHLRRYHPYETMAYDIYPLHGQDSAAGLGRIGSFESRRDLKTVALDIKVRLGLKSVKFAGRADLPVKSAAICSGGGSGVVGDFMTSDADVFISGDLNHHHALDVAAGRRGLIDIGHFASEQLIVPVLARRIEDAVEQSELAVTVAPWSDEPDPFGYL
ncbi:MAG: Nif3-like dinuclear metal center hexameric protein [Thermodesulfobacteriota bacterium]